MVHLNHDRSFWRLVGKIMPDYKEKENWLALINWKRFERTVLTAISYVKDVGCYLPIY
jgi:hypothetical protein